jgi:hypothetical protein
VGFFDVLPQRLRQVRNPALELVHGAVELALVGFVVREETIQQGRYFQRLAQSEFAGFAPILIEDGDLRVLEDCIPRRISSLELLLDFRG